MSKLGQIAFRITALIGLGVSALLVAEYMSSAPSLCTGSGGCQTVRDSAFASIAGIPTPFFGMLYFALTLGLSLFGDARARAWRVKITAVGACAAAALLIIQAAVIGAFCTFCVIVDISALALFGLAWWLRNDEDVARPSRAAIAVHGVVTALVCAIGLAVPGFLGDDFDAVAMNDLPDFVTAEKRPGQVAIVEFMDFTCPHCRAMHGRFAEVLPAYGDKVRFVYKQYPLHGRDGAQAAICAAALGKGEEMTAGLFGAPSPSRASAEEIAESLGIELGAFRECMDSEQTTRQIDRDLADAARAGVPGVPTYWIGERRIVSEISSDALRAQIDSALRAAGIAP